MRSSTTPRRCSSRAVPEPVRRPTGRYSRVFAITRHEYGERPTRRSSTPACTDVPALHFRRRARLRRRDPAQGVDFLDRSYAGSPGSSRRLVADVPRAAARFPLAAAPAQGSHAQRLRVAAVYGLLASSSARSKAGYRSSLRDALRALDGLRGLPRHAHARGLDRRGDNKRAVAYGLERTGRIDHGGRR